MRIRSDEVEIGELGVGTRFRFAGQVDDNKVWTVADKGPKHVLVEGRPTPYPNNILVIRA